MADAAVLIADALAEIDTATDWTAAAETYADELIRLDGEIEEILGDVPVEKRLLVTNHDSLGYFADRYDFEIVGTVIPGGSTLGDPSSADLAELVETMRARSIAVVFADTTNPTRLAEVLTEELGGDVAVVELYTGSLGPEGSGAETLIEMLRTNARLIADALAGE
jgi:zinc/manganese transport system substrate-binding protein